MNKIFITSDLHFGHNKPFLYEPRGFNSIEEHDEEVIRRWNNVVSPEDEVYILGDLMLNDNEHGIECLKRLNGIKHIITGNHDTDKRIALYKNEWYDWCGDAFILKYKKFRFYLSHYPTICSNFDDGKNLRERVINICGHSHSKERFCDWEKYNSAIYHCELDAHDCYPVLLDDIIEDMKQYFYQKTTTI